MFSDDYVGIFIGTFNDGRQATVFGANALGIQGDGILVETGAASSGFSGISVGREPTDIRPDYVFNPRADHGLWLRDRDPHSIQEPDVSTHAVADVEHQCASQGAEPRLRIQLGSGEARGRVYIASTATSSISPT